MLTIKNGEHINFKKFLLKIVLKLKMEIKIKKKLSFRIDDEKPLEKYKTIWTEVEDLTDIELNALPIDDGRYIKIKIRTYGDRICTNVYGLNAPEDDLECESFNAISIDSLLVYK